jgi:hypothetical protein
MKQQIKQQQVLEQYKGRENPGYFQNLRPQELALF